MNSVIERLLQYYPDGYDKQPHDVPALSLSGSGTFLLDDLTLYVTGTNSATIDLHAQKVSQIASLMPSGVAATVLQDGPAELLLYTGQGNIPDILTIAMSPLWQIFASISRTMTGRRRTAQNSINQINTRASVSILLNFWGESLGTPRLAGEPDQLYVTRLICTTLAPNVNNTAMEQLFLDLGYTGTVVDSGNKTFTVNLNFPTVIPSGFIYSQAQLAQIAYQIKAAGTIAIINFLEAITDSMSLSDSVSATSPGRPLIWGSGMWGASNWD